MLLQFGSDMWQNDCLKFSASNNLGEFVSWHNIALMWISAPNITIPIALFIYFYHQPRDWKDSVEHTYLSTLDYNMITIRTAIVKYLRKTADNGNYQITGHEKQS